MKILIEELQRRMKESLDYARDEALRSTDAGKAQDSEKYAISARKHMAIAKAWETAITLAAAANVRITKYGKEVT